MLLHKTCITTPSLLVMHPAVRDVAIAMKFSAACDTHHSCLRHDSRQNIAFHALLVGPLQCIQRPVVSLLHRAQTLFQTSGWACSTLWQCAAATQLGIQHTASHSWCRQHNICAQQCYHTPADITHLTRLQGLVDHAHEDAHVPLLDCQLACLQHT